MWKFIDIDISNLFSHKRTMYTFKQNESCVLIGENKDKSKIGANSNGAGKSSLAEALTLCIIGETYRGVTKERFIMRGQKKCQILLNMYNPVLKEKLTIIRTFNNNTTSNKLQIFENDVENTKITSYAKGNAYILDKIGISQEDLLDYFIIGQGNRTSFFSAGDIKQKQVISRFCNYKAIDKIVESISAEITTLMSEQQRQNEERISIESFIESMTYQIANLEQISDSKIEVDKLKQKLLRNAQDLSEKHDRLESLELRLKESKESINAIKINDVKFQELKEKYSKLCSSIDVIEQKHSDNKRLLNKFSNLLGQELKCPKCEELFIPESEFSVEDVRTNISNLKLKIEKCKKDNISLCDESHHIEEAMEVEKNKSKRKKILIQTCTEIEESIELLNDTISTMEQNAKSIKSNIENLKMSDTNTKLIDGLKKSISEKRLELISVKEAIESTSANIENKRTLQYHFGKTGFKTYLANMSIKHIESMANQYLSKFDTNLSVQINGYKMLKSGELRDKIDIMILEDGVLDGVYKQYSGGEKSRVELCGILTIHSLINNSAEYGKGLDFICIDENIEGLDISGQIEILKILEKTQITSIITMHHVENLQLKNKVFFIKQNKITTITCEY